MYFGTGEESWVLTLRSFFYYILSTITISTIRSNNRRIQPSSRLWIPSIQAKEQKTYQLSVNSDLFFSMMCRFLSLFRISYSVFYLPVCLPVFNFYLKTKFCDVLEHKVDAEQQKISIIMDFALVDFSMKWIFLILVYFFFTSVHV